MEIRRAHFDVPQEEWAGLAARIDELLHGQEGFLGVSAEVEAIDEEVIKTARKMAHAMYKNDGCGIAAPQIGDLRQIVVIDCEAEGIRIDGVDSRNKVALGSDFFAPSPGSCELAFAGCSAFAVRVRESWS